METCPQSIPLIQLWILIYLFLFLFSLLNEKIFGNRFIGIRFSFKECTHPEHIVRTSHIPVSTSLFTLHTLFTRLPHADPTWNTHQIWATKTHKQRMLHLTASYIDVLRNGCEKQTNKPQNAQFHPKFCFSEFPKLNEDIYYKIQNKNLCCVVHSLVNSAREFLMFLASCLQQSLINKL